jgi:hypothetical protein
MKTKPVLILGVLIGALLLPAAIPLRAEYTADISEEIYQLLLLAIIEDPDPVPVNFWDPVYEGGNSGDILNFAGADRGDGRPDTAIHPATGRPLVTWAYKVSADHDIVVSEWGTDSWDETVFLTSDPEDELDPRAHIDDAGRAYVVWWRGDQVAKLFIVSRDPGSSEWGLPELIGHPGRRPSICTVAEGVLVAFERDRTGGGQEVVLLTMLHDGTTTVEVVAETDRTEPLDAMVHFAAGRLWIDWKHGTGQFAYSVHTGSAWSAPFLLPWDEKSWVSEEEARKIARSEVFAN